MERITLGGDRLGSGNKSKVGLRNYERSTQDLSSIFRTTMSAGTLVPFLSEPALPGDKWDIDLDIDVKTMPTIGPLFGSFKVQLDVFQVPIRLFQGALHMNLLDIGMEMETIELPQVEIAAKRDTNLELYEDNSQINASSIFAYFDIRGLGHATGGDVIKRQFNAVPWLSYWSIYRQYYANKQEGIGAVIHNPMRGATASILEMSIAYELIEDGRNGYSLVLIVRGSAFNLAFNDGILPSIERIQIAVRDENNNNIGIFPISELFGNITYDEQNNSIYGSNPIGLFTNNGWWNLAYVYRPEDVLDVEEPYVKIFSLKALEGIHMDILRYNRPSDGAYVLKNRGGYQTPYDFALWKTQDRFSITSKQEGLALKTYQSDMFNNWIQTDWMDGETGINSITAVDTSEGNFSVNSLILANKVYNMLNRIAVSGGTYDDYLEAVYTHERRRGIESPMYVGGLIRELAFQEVVSNASAETNANKQPLGTLAGRGVMTQKIKGGKISINVDEPSYIIGIVSLTPRIDYSQGNKWHNNLKTMADFHKPALDEIGFQDLVTDAMHWADTKVNSDGSLEFRSAGKVPAWINYMTDVNRSYGNFAEEGNQMYMTLNRKYDKQLWDLNKRIKIKDLTTYIDPVKFNNIFADVRRDAMNFWVQISKDMIVRRKMSAKVMPNL